MNFSKYLVMGTSRKQTFTVAEEHTAAHLGSGMLKILSTPSMILFMEITARIMLDELLPEGYSSVGTKVDIEHLAPAPLASEVQATSTIKRLNKNRVRLTVQVALDEILIGTGEHERYIIDVERFLKRIKK